MCGTLRRPQSCPDDVPMTPSRRRTPTRRAGRLVGDWLLSVLALAGSVCIALVVLGVLFDVAIMMFRTGSMSPTIPTGSIALVHEIPATEMDEGDVVTVDRGDSTLPVTHRVTKIIDTDEATGVVTFTMRGDANETDDPHPYAESEVSRVLFSVPGVAPVIQWFSNPAVLGGLTLGASALVVWAFWPRKDDDPDGGPSDETARVPTLTSQQSTARHAAAVPAALLGMALVAAADAPAIPAHTTAAHGDILRMEAFGDRHGMRNLSPGESETWTVDVWADAPEPGEITLDAGAHGTLAQIDDALTVTVTMCSHRVAAADCGDLSTVMESVQLSDLADSSTSSRTLATMSTEEERRLFVTAALSDAADSEAVQGNVGSVTITATGASERLSLGPDGPDPEDDPLPRTGIVGWRWLLLAGGLLVAVGATLVSRRRKGTDR